MKKQKIINLQRKRMKKRKEKRNQNIDSFDIYSKAYKIYMFDFFRK